MKFLAIPFFLMIAGITQNAQAQHSERSVNEANLQVNKTRDALFPDFHRDIAHINKTLLQPDVSTTSLPAKQRLFTNYQSPLANNTAPAAVKKTTNTPSDLSVTLITSGHPAEETSSLKATNVLMQQNNGNVDINRKKD